MKTLLLIRHAKSDWSNPLLNDFERGLNKRGEREAPLMGEVLSQKGIHPDLILSSPALRAKTTAIAMAHKLSYVKNSIYYEPTLYASDVESILSVIRNVSQSVDTLLVFGHNPEFTECVNEICGTTIENIPTCGVVAIRLYTDNWVDIGFNSGELLFFDSPKEHR
ncbi:MAG: histidine phosphatase family protein [Campylobacterales bacterium]|nr:histidine phosphatase family protein [Campylobacterales bacterium]